MCLFALYYAFDHPSGLSADNQSATVLNSRGKAYNYNAYFRKNCDLVTIKMIYEHHQREHINLMSVLESVPEQFYKVPFHSWIHDNNPVNDLKKKKKKNT